MLASKPAIWPLTAMPDLGTVLHVVITPTRPATQAAPTPRTGTSNISRSVTTSRLHAKSSSASGQKVTVNAASMPGATLHPPLSLGAGTAGEPSGALPPDRGCTATGRPLGASTVTRRGTWRRNKSVTQGGCARKAPGAFGVSSEVSARCPFLLTLSMEDQEGMAQWGQQCMRTLSLFRRES